jgi:type IV secretion system protein VirB9
MKYTAIVCALLSLCGSASAMIIPGACSTDEHVQCAVYDTNEVYQVATTAGRATMIQFEQGEFVEQKGAGMGDGKAWTASTTKNWILLKPEQVKPDTNFLIMTNRRRYVLSLVTASKHDPATWALSFNYPDTQAKLFEAKVKKEAAAVAVLQGKPVASNGSRNEAYSMRGDTQLAPTSLWDDGTFTYFQYDTGRDLPRVYAKLQDGSEALANYHMDGDTLVVHETAQEFVIRQGKLVLGIRNDAYAPDGHYNRTGTTVPDQVRILKEKAE